MKTPTYRRVIGIGLLPLLAACGGDMNGDARAAGPVVRDSAGVRIVENSAPAWSEGSGWRLSAEPTLEIGMLDGPPEYQFGTISGVTRLRDGTVVVAERLAGHLRFFDAEGRHLRTAGRKGSGPGEFRTVTLLRSAGSDSLVTFDVGNRRISVFAPDGTFTRSIPIQGDSQVTFPIPLARFADGSFLVNGRVRGANSLSDGASRKPVSLYRLTPESGLSHIARFLGTEEFVQTQRNAKNLQISMQPLPFGRSSAFAAGDSILYAGDTDRFEIGRYAASGELLSIIRRSTPAREVTPADVDAFKRESLRPRTPGSPGRAQMERALAEMPYPATMPAFSTLSTDHGRNLWVLEYEPIPETPGTWTVFDPAGAMLGTVTTPARLQVVEVGDDYVLGVWKDDLDVQTVRLYKLEKPAASQAAVR